LSRVQKTVCHPAFLRKRFPFEQLTSLSELRVGHGGPPLEQLL
jgi:hypothetical protein